MDTENVRPALRQSEDKENGSHTSKKHSPREPKLREININALNSPSETPSEDIDDVKSKIQAANKSLASLHETENQVDKLLERLLSERNRILEITPQGTESKEETITDQDKLNDQENLEPEREAPQAEVVGVVSQETTLKETNQPQDNPETTQIEDLSVELDVSTDHFEGESSTNEEEQTDNDFDSNKENIALPVRDQEDLREYSQKEDSTVENEEFIEEKPVHDSHDEEDKENVMTTSQAKENHIEEEELRITDFLYVNKQHINYGTSFPGQILEETLEIINKSEVDIVVQITVECLNQEFIDSDEYVFAIRRSHSADYNDKHFLLMSPYSSATFKLAVKVPSARMKCPIRGETTFRIQSLEDKITTTMETQSLIPKIASPKELYHADLKCKVVKFAMKNSKKLECKLPIKNHSKMAVALDFELYQPRDFDPQDRFDCICMPSFVNLGPNALTLVNLMLKPNTAMLMEKSTDPFAKEKHFFKKVLIAKCRDSSLIYSFVILIEVFD